MGSRSGIVLEHESLIRCGPDGGEAVWNAVVGLSIAQFLSEKVEVGGGEEWWTSAEKYFTEWNQVWVAGLAPGLGTLVFLWKAGFARIFLCQQVGSWKKTHLI